MTFTPARSALGLLVLGAVLFLLSASGQDGTFWENGPSWLGAIGWFGFLTCLLLLVLTGLYALATKVRHRDQTLPH